MVIVPPLSVPAPHALHVRSYRALVAIHSAEVNMAIVRRRLLPRVAAFAERAARGDARIAFDGDATPLDARAKLGVALAALSADPDADAFLDDVDAVLRSFASVEPADHYRVRLERVSGDSCRLFHVDFVRLRLLCTYHGPGTEWLADGDVVRAALGGEGASVEEVNARIIRPGATIRRMRTGWIGLLKGAAYPGLEERGLVHRSAPIATTGAVRLRLAVEACRHRR